MPFPNNGLSELAVAKQTLVGESDRQNGNLEVNNKDSHESIPLNTIVPDQQVAGFKDHAYKDNIEEEDGEEGEDGDDYESVSNAKQRAEHVISWLRSRFKSNQGTSISRSSVFNQYLELCQQDGVDPVNPATFGKIIRAVFPTLKTRRLGARGSSKYHYYGITTRNTSEALAPQVVLSPEPPQKRTKPTLLPQEPSEDIPTTTIEGAESSTKSSGSASRSLRRRTRKSTNSTDLSKPTGLDSRELARFVTYEPLIPDFDEFGRFVEQICQPISENIRGHPYANLSIMHNFSRLYQTHVKFLLQLISNREFALVEGALMRFWNGLHADLLPCLYTSEGLRIISIADDYLYQVAIHILVPDVLDPLPLPISQNIRYFAKALDVWHFSLFSSYAGNVTGAPLTSTSASHLTIPNTIANAKVDLVRRFTQVLRRRTALNHLSQAIRGIIGEGPTVNYDKIPTTPNNSTQHRQLLWHDLNAVDWNGIREQVNWLIPRQEDFFAFVEATLKTYLQEGMSTTQWAIWMDSLLEQTLAREIAPHHDLEDVSRMIAARWSLMSGLIARDLTLRSAQSFEEYLMFYLERKLDEHRRALGMISYWPTSASNVAVSTVPPIDAPIHQSYHHYPQQPSSSSQQQPQHKDGPPIMGEGEFSFEKVMAGFASMEELFRKSGLLAFCQAINQNGTTIGADGPTASSASHD